MGVQLPCFCCLFDCLMRMLKFLSVESSCAYMCSGLTCAFTVRRGVYMYIELFLQTRSIGAALTSFYRHFPIGTILETKPKFVIIWTITRCKEDYSCFYFFLPFFFFFYSAQHMDSPEVDLTKSCCWCNGDMSNVFLLLWHDSESEVFLIIVRSHFNAWVGLFLIGCLEFTLIFFSFSSKRMKV